MIELHVKKSFRTFDRDFFMDVQFSINPGEFIALMGPSGSGKTTLLRMLAGLTKPDAGYIRDGKATWFDSSGQVSAGAAKRNIGFVFQDFALFPNMSVRQNIAYGAKDRTGLSFWIRLFRLNGLENLRPHKLSGGQKQRAALARTFAAEPATILMDEPLSALDSDLRTCIRDEILKQSRSRGQTVIMVSHELADVYHTSSRVIRMMDGKLVQDGNKETLFSGRESSHKLSFTAEILDIRKSDILSVLVLSVGNTAGEVVVTESEARDLRVGERITINTKAFNPVVRKINEGNYHE